MSLILLRKFVVAVIVVIFLMAPVHAAYCLSSSISSFFERSERQLNKKFTGSEF
jgi:uncharacterized protein YpuA (DUF1002 family)